MTFFWLFSSIAGATLTHDWDFTGVSSGSSTVYEDSVSQQASGTLSDDAVTQDLATSTTAGARLRGQNFGIFGEKDGWVALSGVDFDGDTSFEIVATFYEFRQQSRLFDCGGGTDGQANNVAIFNEASTGVLAFQVERGVENLVLKSSGNPHTPLTLNEKYHIVAVVDGNYMHLYINGILMGSKDTLASAGPQDVTRSKCYIGKSNWNSDKGFNGLVERFLIYSGALSEAEVEARYALLEATSSPTKAPTQAPTIAPTTALPTTAPSTAPSSAPSSNPTTALPTTAPTISPTPAPTETLGALVDLAQSSIVVREDGADAPRDVLSINVGMVPYALAEGEVATVRCAAPSGQSLANAVQIVAPAALSVTRGVAASAAIAVKGAVDALQLPLRASAVACNVAAEGRVTQRFTIPVALLGVAQPSFAFLCPLARGADPLAETPASCAASSTTNGNSTLLIIGGSPATGCATCPQPPFDVALPPIVTIGGVAANATVVPGSNGARLLVRTPTIYAIQDARGAALDDFEYDYYGLAIIARPGAHGCPHSSSVAVGTDAARAAPESAGGNEQQLCAASGLCPDVRPASAGLFYSDACIGWPDASVDGRWKESASAALFAYDRPPLCRACPKGCRCPGGRRCRVDAGFYAPSEDLAGAKEPVRCAPPALLRCTGFSDSLGGAECGPGYRQGSAACGECDKGYYRALGMCEVCPAVDFFGAIVMPAIANVLGATIAFLSVFGLKLIWMLTSVACDRDDTRAVGAIAYDSLRQTAYFTVATLAGLQLLASVVIGATGDAPPVMRWLALSLGTFLFNPPMVNPECVEGGVDLGRAATVGLLLCALLAAALDKALQLLPWLRCESSVFGYKCCSKSPLLRSARQFCYTLATPFLRYFLGTGLTVIYVRIVRVAIGFIDCTPSAELDGAYALDTNALLPCFDADHAPIYALSVVTLVGVGVVWPAASVLYLAQRFLNSPLRAKKHGAACWKPQCVDRLCDSPRPDGGAGLNAAGVRASMAPLPIGWTEHYNEERREMYFFHAASVTSVWDRPTAATAAEVVGHVAGAQVALPEGWEAVLDASTGRPYFVHAESRQTMWEHPSALKQERSASRRTLAALHDIDTLAAQVTETGDSDGKGSLEELEELEEGWVEVHSPEHGASYYHHSKSSTTVWERPLSRRLSASSTHHMQTAGEASGGAEASGESESRSSDDDDESLPQGWVAHTSPAHGGAQFYHNEASGETIWTRPPSVNFDAAPSVLRTVSVRVVSCARERTVTDGDAPIDADGVAGTAGAGDVVGDAADDAAERSVAGRWTNVANELGLIPLCWRKRLHVDLRPGRVQRRVAEMGGRARAYDVYVDNAFEPRFFWIPALRMYTLLLLAIFDLGFGSERTPPTLVGAIARCVLSSAVVLAFTVAVLAPCPYHRIDRWNIARRVALLVLQNIASATTLSLSLVELDGGKAARDATALFASALVVSLPVAFGLVLFAFLLSHGTGCCRCIAQRTAPADRKSEARMSRGHVELVGIAAEEEPKKGVQPPCSFAEMVGGSTASKLHVVNPMLEHTIGGGNTRLSVAQKQGPRAMTIEMTAVDNASDTRSSSSDSEEEPAPRYIARWAKRRSSALTLAAALYGGGSAAEEREVMVKIETEILRMFGNKSTLSVPQTLKLLRTRATGTDLEGNLMLQMKVVEAATDDEHGTTVTIAAFNAALHASIAIEPNGAVAQWLIEELEAAEEAAVAAAL